MEKSDTKAAFRNVPILRKFWKFLVMKARNPITHKWVYFFDKCLPFGSSISCTQFQEVSNAITHIVHSKSDGKNDINYLDDFLFISILKIICDGKVELFLSICNEIGFPVALEKTFWGMTTIIFLGFLIDTVKQIIAIPQDKIDRAVNMIQVILGSKKNKATVSQIQKLCGFLNFLCRCIVPGRPFTTRLYALIGGKTKSGPIMLKPHYHVRVTAEAKLDLLMWLTFLQSPDCYYQRFIDFEVSNTAETLDWYTDAAKSGKHGCGGYHGTHWFVHQWNLKFVEKKNPSIEYLELYAVTVGVVLWVHLHKNKRIYLFCDNESVVKMIMKQSSKCRNCMFLIRIITLYGLLNNTRIFAKHVPTEENGISDALSWLQFKCFKEICKEKGKIMDTTPSEIPELLLSKEINGIEEDQNCYHGKEEEEQ